MKARASGPSPAEPGVRRPAPPLPALASLASLAFWADPLGVARPVQQATYRVTLGPVAADAGSFA